MRLRCVCAAITAITAATAVVATSAGRGPGHPGCERERWHRPQDRLGAEPQDAQPVRGSGRGGLLHLGDQLGPARQLQPEGPDSRTGHRPELGDLRRQEDRDVPPGPGRQVVRRQADHLRGRQVLARGAGEPRRAVHQLHGQRHLDRHAGRAHGGRPHQAARRPNRRRPLHLHPPQAHLGQGAREGADRLVSAGASPSSAAVRTSSPTSSRTAS